MCAIGCVGLTAVSPLVLVCLQVYSFGKTSIVLDNVHSTIRALVRDRWAPVTLETLLQQSMK